MGILVVLISFLSVLVAGPARGVQPACGASITTNVKLKADVGPCPENGLNVQADGIVVDLNGFRLWGAPEVNATIGVDITNHSGVIVKNGSVTNFGTGVRVLGSGGNKISKVSVMFNDAGDGILIQGSSSNVLKENRVIANGPFSGISVIAEEGGATPVGNQIVRNIVRDNAIAQSDTTMSDVGIRLESNTIGTLVSKNEVSFSGLDGITAFDAKPADPTSIGSSQNRIVGNKVKSNGFHTKAHRAGDGIRIGTDDDPATDSPDANVIENNVATNSAGFDLHDTVNVDCATNTWTGNRANTADPPCTTG
jgi:parallel beta-helix repeat protein